MQEFPKVSRETLDEKLESVGVRHRIVSWAFNVAIETHGKKKRYNLDPVLDGHIYPVAEMCIDYCITTGKPITPHLVAGALLHDVLEDNHYYKQYPEALRNLFGNQIYNIVKAVSKPDINSPQFADKPDPRKARNLEFFQELETAPEESKIIVSADRLSNIHCIPWTYNFMWVQGLSRAGVKKFDANNKPDERFLTMLRETDEFYLPFTRKFSPYFYEKFDARLREMCARIPPLFLKTS